MFSNNAKKAIGTENTIVGGKSLLERRINYVLSRETLLIILQCVVGLIFFNNLPEEDNRKTNFLTIRRSSRARATLRLA